MGYRKPETYGEDDWRRVGNQVQSMIRQGWQVWAKCQSCGLEITVPLLAVAGARGGSYSLFGETIPCKALGCKSRMAYFGKPPEGRFTLSLTAPPGEYSLQVRRRNFPTPADKLPTWAQSAGSLYAMVGRGGYCTFRCQVCKGRGAVDLVDVISNHGLGFSLIDRVAPCRGFSCQGAVRFIAGPALEQMIGLQTGPLPMAWDRSVHEAMVCRIRY